MVVVFQPAHLLHGSSHAALFDFHLREAFLLLNPEVLGLPRYEVMLLNGVIHEQSISTKIIDTAEFSLEKTQPRLNLTDTMA